MYTKNDPQSICALFDSIAKDYDRANAVLSWQLHKRWNRALIAHALTHKQPEVLLDLCCGSGAIALSYLQQTPKPTTAYLLDFSEQMLNCARTRATQLPLQHHTIHYLQADAQQIPLPNSSVDCVTIAYGIRNVQHRNRCFNEVYRVLKKGGTFGILELTQPSNKFLRLGHTLYLRTLLPLIGKLLTSNKEAYRYLCNSIHSFVPPTEIEKELQHAGFKSVAKHPHCGGCATLFISSKNLP